MNPLDPEKKTVRPLNLPGLTKDCDSNQETVAKLNEGKKSSTAFCSTDNIQNTVVHLSKEFQSLGLRHRLIEGNGKKLNVVGLINSSWDVVQLYQSAVRDTNILHDLRRRDTTDFNHLKETLGEVKDRLEEKERSLSDAQERERQTSSINKALAVKLKAEKEEIKRLANIIQQRDGQFHHEMRKKEIEADRLKDKLHHLVSSDRTMSEGRVSQLTMTGSLNRSDRSRGRWRTDDPSIKVEDELYRRVLGQYEMWVNQLTEELSQAKDFAIDTLFKISKFAEKGKEIQVENLVDGSSPDKTSLMIEANDEDRPILFALNFQETKKGLEKKLEESLSLISQLIESKGNLEADKCNFDSYVISDSFHKEVDAIAENSCIEQLHSLNKQLTQLQVDRKVLQGEKERFALAAVRLNRERSEFEIEKVELLRQKFLSEMPGNISANREPTTPNNTKENSLKISLDSLLNDSPILLGGLPNILSPRGDIKNVDNPLMLGGLGNSKIIQYGTGRLTSTQETNHGQLRPTGKSAPTTRHPSLGRTFDDPVGINNHLMTTKMRTGPGSCHNFKSHTLDRPVRATRSVSGANVRERSQSTNRRGQSKDRGQEIVGEWKSKGFGGSTSFRPSRQPYNMSQSLNLKSSQHMSNLTYPSESEKEQSHARRQLLQNVRSTPTFRERSTSQQRLQSMRPQSHEYLVGGQSTLERRFGRLPSQDSGVKCHSMDTSFEGNMEVLPNDFEDEMKRLSGLESSFLALIGQVSDESMDDKTLDLPSPRFSSSPLGLRGLSKSNKFPDETKRERPKQILLKDLISKRTDHYDHDQTDKESCHSESSSRISSRIDFSRISRPHNFNPSEQNSRINDKDRRGCSPTGIYQKVSGKLFEPPKFSKSRLPSLSMSLGSDATASQTSTPTPFSIFSSAKLMHKKFSKSNSAKAD